MEMNLGKKSLVGLGLGLALGMFSVAAQAVLSFHDAPIMGTNVTDNGNGSVTIIVNGTPQIISDANALPSQSVFNINTPPNEVWAASSVNADPTSTYHYVGLYEFLGNGPNPAYNLGPYPENDFAANGLTILILYSSVFGFTSTDVGDWLYTETWTGIAGPDTGETISFTRAFCVDDGSGACAAAVPEPVSLALLGIGLAGLGFSRRKRS